MGAHIPNALFKDNTTMWHCWHLQMMVSMKPTTSGVYGPSRGKDDVLGRPF